MTAMIDGLLVILVLTGFLLLGSSRLAECIRMVALQGLALGFLPLLIHSHDIGVRLVLITVGTMILKGFVFPRLLFRAVREAHIRREVEPLVGFTLSLLIGILILSLSFWLGRGFRCRTPSPRPSLFREPSS